MNLIYPAIGAAIALAGGDKLYGQRGYDKMFRHLGWSRDTMLAAAAAETAGGVLMVLPGTRRLGGTLVAAVSAPLLMSEIRHGDSGLAVARGAVLLAGLAALFTRHSRPA